MDPFTHGILGATIGCALASDDKKKLRASTLIGASAAIAPDLDVFIHSASDPLMRLEYHRHFTHSLFFVPLGAALLALLWWYLFRRTKTSSHLRFTHIYFISCCAMASHGLLDTATSYGTRLLWPLYDTRFAWDIIAIIDPLFTVPALLLLIFAVKHSRKLLAYLSLAWMTVYLGLGCLQHHRVVEALHETAQARGHTVERYTIQPTILNLLLWRGIYQYDGRYYADAYRAGLHNMDVFYGSSLPIYRPPSYLSQFPEATLLQQDIQRFRFFSNGFITNHPKNPLLLIDIRYSSLPNTFDSLWSVRLTPDQPDAHASFINLRSTDTSESSEPLMQSAATLWSMLKGTR